MRHIKGLDTLRAFAVFFVLIEHNGVWFDTTVTNGRFIRDVLIPDGGFGVDLFFTLSGFLITSILLSERNTPGGPGWVTIKNFFARRALRIFPIYYLLLFLLLATNYPDVCKYSSYYLTYTGNMPSYRINSWTYFSHTWTLCVEEQFYLLWPWLILFINRKYLKYVFYGSIGLGIITTYYVSNIDVHIAPILVWNSFDAFGIGGLYAYYRSGSSGSESANAMLRKVGTIALGIYFYWKVAGFFHSATIYGMFLIKTINGVLSVWLIAAVVNSTSGVIKKYFLENRFLNYIGRISYGIYLYHYVYNVIGYEWLLTKLRNITTPYAMVHSLLQDHHFYYWLQMGVVVLIATISYYVIERPILKLKKYFSGKRPSAS